jgi:hypothetical protein
MWHGEEPCHQKLHRLIGVATKSDIECLFGTYEYTRFFTSYWGHALQAVDNSFLHET